MGVFREDQNTASELKVSVGVMDRCRSVSVCLNGRFAWEGQGGLSGEFNAVAEEGSITITASGSGKSIRSDSVRLSAGTGSTFTLRDVTIGNRFHWERAEDQTFQGNIILSLREDGTMAVINEIRLEDYLTSVISSEMKATAPPEFLKVHSILSRSWLLKALRRKKRPEGTTVPAAAKTGEDEELTRWYEQEEHDLFDVCADDHCQRYQGVTKIISEEAGIAVRETAGKVITFQGEICDARYSKACGGLTEIFATAWSDRAVPYLTCVSDSAVLHRPPATEEEAARWILSEPDAYCNVKDPALLEEILPGFDRETKDFFRWKVGYPRKELEAVVREKSGLDFGTLMEIVPLVRGPSGRISRLRITGTKRTVIVGKELEIRRWLSRSHLYSSAFVVSVDRGAGGEVEKFTFHGAGWGHGVGLCQIGAAVMASRGFTAEEIIAHYFPGTELRTVYDD